MHGHLAAFRRRLVDVAGEPRIQLIGYGPSASTIGANRAGQAAARQLRRLLRDGEQSAA